MSTHHTFKGNPGTNDAARYSAALANWREAVRIWNLNGRIGPQPARPPKPPSLEAAERALATAQETDKERAARIQREAEARRRKLF